MKKNQEVYLKLKGKIMVCTSKTLCDLCLKWIEKGEKFGYAALGNEEYQTTEEIANCLTCLKETK